MRITIIVTLCVMMVLGAGIAAFRHFDRTHAQPFRDLSKMMSVRHTVWEGLSEYYQQHGNYPNSLTNLPLQTMPWGDEGSSPADVELWSYNSDGSAFTMTWTNAPGMELFFADRNDKFYFTIKEFNEAQ